MAIIPSNEYPPQTISGDPVYPYGRARNEIVPGDGVGTPLEERWVNDLWGFLQALLVEGGVVPSGNPDNAGDSNYLTALQNVVDVQIEGLTEIVRGSAAFDPMPSRELVFHGSVFKPFRISGDPRNPLLEPAAAGAGWSVGAIDEEIGYICPLSKILPAGAEFTHAALMINVGVHPAAGRGRLTLHAVQYDFQSVPPAAGPHVEVDGADTVGGGMQLLALTPPAAQVGGLSTYYLVYLPGELTSGVDVLESLRLVWNDPGPRNA